MLPPIFSRQCSGKIAGMFQNSFHIELSDPESRSFLIHVGPSSRPLCAFGLSIDDEAIKEMISCCPLESLVYFKPGRMIIYGQGEQFCLEWETPGFSTKDLRIPVLKETDIERAVLQSLTGQVEAWEKKMGIPWDKDFFRYSHILRKWEEKEQLKEAAAFFCGRGLGLTPSGDDILLGYECVMKAAGNPAGDYFASYLSKTAANKTTKVSQAYYKAAGDGFINEDFKEFLLYAFGQGRSEKEDIIEQVKSLGHTSGHDTLFGAFLGLERLNSKR